jgi:hypothetical protein
MEFTGMNLLLLLFAPLSIIFLLVLLLSPLINRNFDRHKTIKQQLNKDLRHEVEEARDDFNQGKVLTKAERDIRIRRVKRLVKDGMRKIISAHNEESGADDFKKELKKDIKDIFK